MRGVVIRLCGLTEKVPARPVFCLKILNAPGCPERLDMAFWKFLIHGADTITRKPRPMRRNFCDFLSASLRLAIGPRFAK